MISRSIIEHNILINKIVAHKHNDKATGFQYFSIMTTSQRINTKDVLLEYDKTLKITQRKRINLFGESCKRIYVILINLLIL